VEKISRYKDVLALGGFDITHHLIMYLLKPIERGMKTAGMPDPTTDVADLAKKAFVHLDGVSDEWLQSLQVDKIAGGQVPANEEFRLKVELGANRGILKLASCCSPGEK
jgi:NitT/TauT family transport system substrate-binding protein